MDQLDPMVISYFYSPHTNHNWTWESPAPPPSYYEFSPLNYDGSWSRPNPSSNQLAIPKFPKPAPQNRNFLVPLNSQNDEINLVAFVLFFASEIILGLVGFYLSSAAQNSEWQSSKWDWRADSTYSSAVGGGVEGVFLPFAFYYSYQVVGIEMSFVTAILGAYLGSAAENKDWDMMKWDLTSPKTFNGAFEGMQNTVWLIDAINSIYTFTRDTGLRGWEESMFLATTYGTGAVISYYYIAEENNKNYTFLEWEVLQPDVIYGLVRGFQAGTRIPVGFGQILNGFLQTLEESADKPFVLPSLLEKYLNRERWKIAGALWLAIVYTSVENESLDLNKWDISKFGTLESFVGGTVFGMGLQEMFRDVQRYFLTGGGTQTSNPEKNRIKGGKRQGSFRNRERIMI